MGSLISKWEQNDPRKNPRYATPNDLFSGTVRPANGKTDKFKAKADKTKIFKGKMPSPSPKVKPSRKPTQLPMDRLRRLDEMKKRQKKWRGMWETPGEPKDSKVRTWASGKGG